MTRLKTDSAFLEQAQSGREKSVILFRFPEEPTLSESEQAEVDRIADLFEVQRLIRKGVLRCVGAKGEVPVEGAKQLSTKFVRTWRHKTKDGKEQVLRRSRLVAREYKWLETDRLDAFAPATNTSVAKLLPWFFARKRMEDRDSDDPHGMLALDIRDAYLAVPQKERVRASMPCQRITQMLLSMSSSAVCPDNATERCYGENTSWSSFAVSSRSLYAKRARRFSASTVTCA